MMAVARYWESISNKTEVLFSVLDEETQATFTLDHGNTYKMNDGLNQKFFLRALKTKPKSWM